MGARVTGRQVFQWTQRNVAYLASTRGQHGSGLSGTSTWNTVQHVSMSCRLLSSSKSTIQSLENNHELSSFPKQSVIELSLPQRSLFDMGFTDTQVEQVYEAVAKVKAKCAADHALSSLSVLFALGFNPSTVLKVLEKCPELFQIKQSQLDQRIDNLRKLGLVEGSLQRVLTYYPQILTLHVKIIKRVVLFLREKCLFTTQQITDTLRDCPAIVQEDLGQLEYKFQYVYFRMGVKQAEMVKSKLFRFPLEEIRCRHCFLERRGLYQTPDKKGQTLILNPKLSSILSVDRDTYLADLAQATAEEYDVFGKIVAREWQEEEQQRRVGDDEEDDTDDNDYDDDDDEVEEEGRKSSYMRRRKK